LHIEIYESPNITFAIREKTPYGTHGSIVKIPGKMDVQTIFNSMLDKRTGKLLVTGKPPPLFDLAGYLTSCISTVSTHDFHRDAVRKLVRSNLENHVELLNLEFQPTESNGVWPFIRRDPKRQEISP